jgi:hypothetical protein
MPLPMVPAPHTQMVAMFSYGMVQRKEMNTGQLQWPAKNPCQGPESSMLDDLVGRLRQFLLICQWLLEAPTSFNQ